MKCVDLMTFLAVFIVVPSICDALETSASLRQGLLVGKKVVVPQKSASDVLVDVSTNSKYRESIDFHLRHLDDSTTLEADDLISFLKNGTHPLEKTGRVMSPLYTDFLPVCFGHVKTLLRRLDLSYTDVRLRDVLVNACKATKEFPLVYDEGFKSADGCAKFADLLVDAREHELKVRSTRRYNTFCRSFYRYVYGDRLPHDDANNAALAADQKADEAEEMSKPAPQAQEKGSPMWIWALVLLFVVLLVAGGVFWWMSRKKKAQPHRVSGAAARHRAG